jgi:hypothetical protein
MSRWWHGYIMDGLKGSPSLPTDEAQAFEDPLQPCSRSPSTLRFTTTSLDLQDAPFRPHSLAPGEHRYFPSFGGRLLR